MAALGLKQSPKDHFHPKLEELVSDFLLGLRTFCHLNRMVLRDFEGVKKEAHQWFENNPQAQLNMRNLDDFHEVLDTMEPTQELMKNLKESCLTAYDVIAKVLSKAFVVSDERFGTYPVDHVYEFQEENKSINPISTAIRMLGESVEQSSVLATKKEMEIRLRTNKETAIRMRHKEEIGNYGVENPADVLVDLLQAVISKEQHLNSLLGTMAEVCSDYKCFIKEIGFERYKKVADCFFVGSETCSQKMHALWYFTRYTTSVASRNLSLEEGTNIWEYFQKMISGATFDSHLGSPDQGDQTSDEIYISEPSSNGFDECDCHCSLGQSVIKNPIKTATIRPYDVTENHTSD